MKTTNKFGGVAVAAAAAALFMAGIGTSVADEGHSGVVKVRCFGGNACKGQSACQTTTNACKGQNECKGQGVEFRGIGACKERLGRE
jgi:uncharacterized membrane protein